MSLAEVEGERAQPSKHIAALPVMLVNILWPKPQSQALEGISKFRGNECGYIGLLGKEQRAETVMTEPQLNLSSLDRLLAEY